MKRLLEGTRTQLEDTLLGRLGYVDEKGLTEKGKRALKIIEECCPSLAQDGGGGGVRMMAKMIAGIEDRVLVSRLKKLEDKMDSLEGGFLVHVPEVSVKLIRGQRGTYGWEIKVNGDEIDSVMRKLKTIDNNLRIIYGGGGSE
ncbi:MAG: hypothetical protein DRO95_03230 [Candidatus Altiarchaeales archaeon]|nr:MAG: hypothetical protein DRO95_03230 [Candidatus Altiarchaeales archaeon]